MSVGHNLTFAASVVTSLGGAGYGSVEALQAAHNNGKSKAFSQVASYVAPEARGDYTMPEGQREMAQDVHRFARGQAVGSSSEVRGNILRAATGGMFSILGVAGALNARERKGKEQEDAAKGNSR